MEKPVSLDVSRCTGCELCVDVCPEKIFRVENGQLRLQEGKCMVCGHCLAACPTRAITVMGLSESLGLDHVKELDGTSPPGKYDSETLVQLMRSRRSCRNFLTKPVRLSLLTDLVKIGTTAPSGTNCQAWSFAILPGREEVKAFGGEIAGFYCHLNQMAENPFYRFLSKLTPGDGLNRYYRRYYASVKNGLESWEKDGVDSLFHGATAAIVVMGEKEASCPAEDALLVTQNILLAAHALGLGSCLIGFAVEAARRRAEVRKYIQMEESQEIYSVIALGYSAEKYSRPAGRKVVEPKIITGVSSSVPEQTQ